VNNLEKYLKEVKDRCAAATEGPWGYEDRVGYGDIIDEEGVGIANEVLDNDARFIAHARQDVEVLLKMVTAMQPHIKHLNKTAFEKWINIDGENSRTELFYPFKQLEEKLKSLIPKEGE